jgi:hypothetical protein
MYLAPFAIVVLLTAFSAAAVRRPVSTLTRR